jgi:hypothetical protein
MKKTVCLAALAGLVAVSVQAEGNPVSAKQSAVIKQLLTNYTAKAKDDILKSDRKVNPAKELAFTAEVGREFYLKRRTWESHDRTCSGCHTPDPTKEGKHIETKKPIKPLAPGANPERFTDVAKVEKNFTEHCIDLHSRDCTAAEKGNFITYLMSAK